MEEEINSRGTHPLPPKKNKLNTKRCCFLCLKIADFKAEGGSKSETSQSAKDSTSLKCVIRHLNPITKRPPSREAAPENNDKASSTKEKEIEVDLCESCERIVNAFSKSFLLLEKAQMEVSYWLGTIHRQISEGSKNSELVQNYSKRMTSDPKTLTQLVFVDKLRKEIAKKSFKEEERLLTMPKVDLFRLNNIKKYLKPLQKIEEPEMEQNEGEFEDLEDGCYSTADMSPLGASIEDEDSKAAVPVHKETSQITVSDVPTFSAPSTSTLPNKELHGLNAVSAKSLKMYNKNPKTGTLDCITCQKKFKSRFGALFHYKSAHLGTRFKCDLCGKIYKKKYTLEKHKKVCDGTRSIAKKPKPRTKFVRRHHESNYLQKKKECNVCNKVFTCRSSLHKHLKICKDSISKRLAKQRAMQTDPKYKFPCKTCEQRFVRLEHLQRHVKTVHLNESSFECNLCEKKFKSITSLKMHQDHVHFGKKLKCKNCEKCFSCYARTAFRRHERNCEEKKMIPMKIETDANNIL